MYWKDDYRIGVGKIDDQHQVMFNMLEMLMELYKNDYVLDKYDKIRDSIDMLEDYAISHFESEEEYMLSIGYDGYAEQVNEHNLFKEKIYNIDLTDIDNDQNGNLLELIGFITDWLIDHIIKKDKLIPTEI